MQEALGIIEAVGLGAAIAALDAAAKTASVRLLGHDRVIGVESAVGVVIYLTGPVSDVKAAVASGRAAAEHVGRVAGVSVIARPHDELDQMIETIQKKRQTWQVSAEPTAQAGAVE